jgi:hypothetical protein
MQILDGQTSSDIANGTADKNWLKTTFTGIVDGIVNFFDKTTQQIGLWIDGLTFGGVNLGDWYRSDPVGATAAVTGVGVVAYLGGSLIGAISGAGASIFTMVRSLGVMGSLRAAGSAAFNGLKNGMIWALGHPGALVSRYLAGVTAGAVIRWCVGGAIKLLNFNWQATDKQLDDQVTAAQNALWGVAGSSFGQILGTALCGIAPGAAVVRVNPAKLAAIKEVNQELYEEIFPAVNTLVMSAVNVVRTKAFVEIYKNTRKWIKSNSNFIRNFSPFWADLIDNWGKEGSKPWTINSAIEEKIEEIKNPGFRNFAENAWEEFVDSCTEALFVFSTAFG